MAKNKKGVEVRAYQILNSCKSGLNGKKVMQKKIDAITAFEIVEWREAEAAEMTAKMGMKMGGAVGRYGFRIVEATINNGKILGSDAVKAAGFLTFDACVDQIASYKKFKAAPTSAAKSNPEEMYTGVAEVWLRDTQDRGEDEVYDALYQMCLKATEQDGKVVLTIPKGFEFRSATVPEKDYAFVED